MGQTWYSRPEMKVEAGATEIQSDTVSVQVMRPINAVSYAKIRVDDHDAKTFIANLDAFTILKISFRYGDATSSWTQVFEGTLEDVGPELDGSRHTVTATAYGYGRALRNTHCNVNYGAESENSTIDTPEEIWDDLVDNHINKNFDGGATGYAITKTKIKSIASPTINFIRNPYRPCIDVINQVCDVYTADQAGSASVHWWVDTSKNLWIDTIAGHTVDTANWPTYWGATQAASTLTQGEDFINYFFRKHLSDYANKVVLVSPLRKPGYDYLTEDSGGQALWGKIDATVTDDNTAGFVVVGSHSLKIEPTHGVNPAQVTYPAGQNAAWDLTKIGSEHSVPTLNFYLYGDIKQAISKNIRLVTSPGNYFVNIYLDSYLSAADEWHHISLPVGPYFDTVEQSRRAWNTVGAPDWSDIDFIHFNIVSVATTNITWVDDLHFSGKVVREAYNSTDIGTYDEHQKVIRMDTAVDDTMNQADDSGTAAQLAYAELLASQYIPRVGSVTVPGIVDVLPGQLTHLHAEQQPAGTYRIDADFRVVLITHTFDRRGFRTQLDVTDDVTNSYTYGPHQKLREMARVLYTDPEAKNVKGSGVDLLVSRLSVDYP